MGGGSSTADSIDKSPIVKTVPSRLVPSTGETGNPTDAGDENKSSHT